MSISDWIVRGSQWYPDKLALVAGERRFTYAQFNARVNRQANGLIAGGMQRGDRIAYLGNNSVEAVECTAAAAKAAFVHVPISFRLSNREVRQILEHSGARVLIIETEFAEKLGEIGDCPALEKTIRFDPGDTAASPFEAWLATQADGEPDVDPLADDNFLIVYTSGTTGSPKGVLFQQRQSVAHAPIPILYYDIRADSRLLMVYPHNSVASINMFYIPAWVVGATVVMADARGFVAERWLSLVETEKITHCHLVPTMLIRVLDSGAAARFDLSSLQTLGYGSAAMPRERIEQLHKTFGSILVQGYGMTEVSSLAAVLTKADHAKALTGDGRQLSACGRAVFGCELRVVDDNGRAVRDGEIGEIVFRSPQVTTGYWRDTERTQAAIQNDWLHSGDLATIDSEGYIYIVDRKSDIIISGGFNVSSKEVEEIIGWHPSVREAAVVARPDQEWGEKVHAFVVLRSGATLTQTELIAFCRDKLAGIKCPDAVEFIDELPRNALGKLIKSELRGWVRAHASANQVKSHA